MFAKKAFGALIICCLAFAASQVSAKELDQSFADAGYYHGERDDFDLDGALVNAAFGIFSNLTLRGGYTRAATDDYPGDTPDFNEFRGGLRIHYSLLDGDDLNLFGEVLGFRNWLNGNQTNESDIGIIWAGGIRYRMFKKAELLLAGEYRGGLENDTFLVIGPVFHLTKSIALNLKTSQGSDNSNYFGGIRIGF